MKQKWFWRAMRFSFRALVACLLIGAMLLGFGTRDVDAATMRAFADAVARWQHDPEFRAIHLEYVDLGSAAVRTRVAGVQSGSAILFLRSLPGLPAHLRVNATSYDHYKSFAAGPLGAYLHLSAEQGLNTAFGLLQNLAKTNPLDDATIVSFMGNFKLHEAAIADAGALNSVRKLVGDIEPSRGFIVTERVVEKIEEHALKLAEKLGYPADLSTLSVAQQNEVWQKLDAAIKQNDYELWRSKQVSDWLSGVWAQGYGPMYSAVIGPALVARQTCRIAAPVVCIAWIALAVRKRRTRATAAHAPAEPTVV